MSRQSIPILSVLGKITVTFITFIFIWDIIQNQICNLLYYYSLFFLFVYLICVVHNVHCTYCILFGILAVSWSDLGWVQNFKSWLGYCQPCLCYDKKSCSHHIRVILKENNQGLNLKHNLIFGTKKIFKNMCICRYQQQTVLDK